MARKKVEASKQEAGVFNISLEEFTRSLPQSQVESRAGFAVAARGSGFSGKRPTTEWQTLYRLFQTKPVSVDFGEWVEKAKEKK